MSYTKYTLEGLGLRDELNLRWDVKKVAGLDSFPETRGQSFVIPYKQGEYSARSKAFYNPKQLAIVLELFPQDAAGDVPQSMILQRRDNLDALFGALYKPESRVLTLTREWSDGEIRKIDFRTEQAGEVTIGETAATREVTIYGRTLEPFWRSDPTSWSPHVEANIASTSHAFNLVTGGNAPIHDAIVRFTANSAVGSPRLEWNSGATPEYIAYQGTIDAGRWLEFDIGRRTLTWDNGDRADAGVAFQYPWWMEFPPAETVAMTASCSAASDWDVTITGHDKWF